jgi:uncharacterized membrane protein
MHLLPAVLLAFFILVYMSQFLAFALATYFSNGYSGYDLGKNGQTVWLISRLQLPYNTIRGMNAFGDHMHAVMFLLAPLYWVWPSPAALLSLNILLRGLGAYFLYLIVVRQLRSRWMGLFFAAILLLNPEYGNASLDHFYPESLASPLILLAFYFLLLEDYRKFYLVAAVLMSVKEDAPLIVFMMALYQTVFVAGRYYLAGRAAEARRIAYGMSLLMAASLAYFYVSLQVIGYFSGNTRGFSDGNYFAGLAENKFNPSFYRQRLMEPEVLTYLDSVFGPLAYLPLLAPQVSLICLPSLAFNIFTAWPYARNISFHYSVYVTPFLILGVVSLFGRLREFYLKYPQRRLARVACLAVGAVLAVSLAYSTLDYNRRLCRLPLEDYNSNIQKNLAWYASNRERMVVEAAEYLIPAGANVSADPFLVTGLSSRQHVYQFTNPWKAMYYGDPDLPDPGSVDYVLVKYAVMRPEERRIVDGLVESGEFAVLYSEGGNIRLLKRVQPRS